MNRLVKEISFDISPVYRYSYNSYSLSSHSRYELPPRSVLPWGVLMGPHPSAML